MTSLRAVVSLLAVAVPLSSATVGLAGPPTQVNVSALGANIVGDAANEPSLAVDPTNARRLVIGWRQFDSIASNFREAGYASSTDGGRTWLNGGPHTNGIFRSDPVLDARADGTIIYHSLRGNFECDSFLSADGGATWTAPTFAFGGDKAWITTDRTTGVGRDNIYACWSTAAGTYAATPFCRSIDGGLAWQQPIAMPTPIRWGTLSVSPEGNLYLVGIQSSPFNLGVFYCVKSVTAKNKTATATFEPAVALNLGGVLRYSAGPNPAGLLGQMSIEAGASGAVYVLSSIDPPATKFADDPLDVHFIRSLNGGATWSAPMRVNTDAPHANSWNWMGTMSLAPNGRLDVVYLSTHESGLVNISRLYGTQSDDGGASWSAPVALTQPFNSFVGWPQQNKMGDYFHMRSDALGANLAFCMTANGEQDVWFARIGPRDCDGDGISDSCGSSDADFDNNGVVDAADLAHLLNNWGSDDGDLTGDMVTDGADLASLLDQWQ